jgi:hypothetical protein
LLNVALFEMEEIGRDKMKKKPIDWIVTHDGHFNPFGHQCLRCGAYHKLPDKLPVNEFLKIANAFISLHKFCKEKTNGSST